MSRAEVFSIANSMGLEVEDAVPMESSPVLPTNVLDTAFLSNEHSVLDASNMEINATNTGGGGAVTTSGGADSTLATATGSTESASTGVEEGGPTASTADDGRYDDIISSFCDITGSDPTQARHFLEVQ
jgi:hypothetical protein